MINSKSLNPSFFLSAVLFLLSASGCAAPDLDFSLKQPYIHSGGVQDTVPVIIGVDGFVDLRPQTRGSENKKWLGVIPGVLWIEISSDMPEFFMAFESYSSRSLGLTLAEAVTDTLKDAGVSRDLVFLPENPYREVDYRLEGVLRRSLVKETGYYYGLAIYFWAFRVLGLPYVSYEMTLSADLRLRSISTGKVIWQGQIEGSREDKFRSVYELARGEGGKHILAYNFSKILADSMASLIPEIREALAGTRIARNTEELL